MTQAKAQPQRVRQTGGYRSSRELRDPPHTGPPPAGLLTNYLPTGSAGEASVDQIELDATAAWFAHVEAEISGELSLAEGPRACANLLAIGAPCPGG